MCIFRKKCRHPGNWFPASRDAQIVPKNETAKTITKSNENLAQKASVMHVLVAGFFEIK